MKKVTKNNKGFSLIELIIVIAIMAVLVAIIAPNLTKYLGSSKKNTDKKNADEIASTLKTCITDFETDPANGELLANNKSLVLTWDGKTCDSKSQCTGKLAPFKTIVDKAIDPTKPQSKENASYGIATISKADDTYTITVNIGNGSAKN